MFRTVLNNNEVMVTTNILLFQNPNAEPMALTYSKILFPYIIIIASNLSNNVNYYINVEKHLIPLPPNSNFVNVMDMFYKIHKVFDIEYNSSLKPFMHFIEYYFYKSAEPYIEITPKMRAVYNKLVG